MADNAHRTRLDKWLWAARFFKTRSLAAEAIEGGKVEVNGERAKRAKLVGAGDELRVRQGLFEHVVRVREVSERRGSAAIAQTLYDETPESRAAREALARQLRDTAPSFAFGEGRPSKKERRDIRRLKDRG